MSRTVRGTLIVAAFACSLGLIAAACSNHGSQTSAPSGSQDVPAATPSGAGVVPDDWTTYENATFIPLRFRHPAALYAAPGQGAFTSWDPATWSKPYDPPGGFRLNFNVAPLIPADQIEQRPAAASDATLGGSPGWEIEHKQEATTDRPAVRTHVIASDHGDYRVYLIGTFAGDNPDETTFSQIARSPQFV